PPPGLFFRLLQFCLRHGLALGITKQHELSMLKLVRHLQALADRWLYLLFAPPAALCSFLHQTYTTVLRLPLQALRKRRTTAQLLRESLAAQNDFLEPVLALAA